MYLLKRKKKGEGFTLIELLIVIVIIGILISIALPNFKAAQDRAKNASLESNMRTLSVIAQTYSVDWGGNVADNVTVLHNEATAKNYWKDLKNPFTGQSGLGFAISNYSQAVSLISLLQGVKLAVAIEPATEYMKTVDQQMYYKAQPATIAVPLGVEADYSRVQNYVNDSAQNATESIPSPDQIFSAEGQIAYFPDISGTNYAIIASGKDAVGAGSVRQRQFLSKKGMPFVLSAKGSDKLASALKNAANNRNNGFKDGEGINPRHENQELYDKIYSKYQSEYSADLDKISSTLQSLDEKKAALKEEIRKIVGDEVIKQADSFGETLSGLTQSRDEAQQSLDRLYEERKMFVEQSQRQREELNRALDLANQNGDTATVSAIKEKLTILDQEYAAEKKKSVTQEAELTNKIQTIESQIAETDKAFNELRDKVVSSSPEVAELVKSMDQIEQEQQKLRQWENDITQKVQQQAEETYSQMMYQNQEKTYEAQPVEQFKTLSPELQTKSLY